MRAPHSRQLRSRGDYRYRDVHTLFAVLEEHAVDRAGVILKTSMVLSGSENAKQDTLRRRLPKIRSQRLWTASRGRSRVSYFSREGRRLIRRPIISLP